MEDFDFLCDGCPPPFFDLPPPPRPPWLEPLEDCDDSPLSTFEHLSAADKCDANVAIVANPFEETFHSLAISIVCLAILSIFFALAAIVFIR